MLTTTSLPTRTLHIAALVRRCVEYIEIVQSGNPYLHWDGHRGSFVDMYTVSALVSFPDVHVPGFSDECVGSSSG